jgi:formate/nitrite transporter FocA (FNT family)
MERHVCFVVVVVVVVTMRERKASDDEEQNKARRNVSLMFCKGIAVGFVVCVCMRV